MHLRPQSLSENERWSTTSTRRTPTSQRWSTRGGGLWGITTQGQKRGAENSPQEEVNRDIAQTVMMEPLMCAVDLLNVCAIDHCDEEPEEWETVDLDDDPDAPGLDPVKVKAGKDRELNNMEKYPIFEERLRSEVDGPLITTKWHCTVKKDEVRCRFVARDFKALGPWRDDVYTPAAEQPTSRIVDLAAAKKGWPTALLDAVCAYFQAMEEDNVFTEPPEEWKQKQRQAGDYR